MNLTLDNYYDPDRPYLSNSQINDFLLSPEYYEQKYIKRDPALETVTTDVMKRGLVVDDHLTGDGTVYVRKVLKRDDPEEYANQKELDDRFIVPATYYDQALEVVAKIKAQSFWRTGVKRRIFQRPFTGEIHGVPVCGLPDWIDPFRNNTLRVVDLKVVSPMKIATPAKWHFNAVEMGYYRQAELYRRLVANELGAPLENVDFVWAVASYVRPGLVHVNLYRPHQAVLDEAWDELCGAVAKIEAGGFKEKKVGWRDVIDL